ncbi:MAG: fimbrillin family protein [Prevotella sp.]|nr:fimbrillin family protein [Prevotella sp.]
MAGCTAEQETYDGGQQTERMPVLFSAGNTETVITRAASASFMPKDSRFVCSMFFHAGANDDNDTEFYSETQALAEDVNMTTAWLKISNTVGNAVYWNNAYAAATKTDSYGFDEAAKCFYWQNRLNHIFLALADYNKLNNDNGTDAGNLRLYPSVTTQYKDQYMMAYDLTRGNKTAITQQPDPILAVEVAKPSGATPEANRVKLFFKHQFSQVQVNLKNSQDASVTISPDQILSVELLGVAETGYVAYCIQPDGSVPATTSAPINVDDARYNATKKDNPYGSLFSLFERTTTTPGYLKSFEGIAFGTLQGIRISWKESDAADAVVHKATFKGVKNLTLESGKKYIYNMELRRSLIAQVTAEIADWETDKTVYDADATIQNNE